MLMDPAHRAAVCDHEDPLGRMPRRYPVDGGEDSLRVRLVGLTLPAVEGFRLFRGQALDRTDVDLAQIRIDGDGNVQPRAHDVSGVPRAAQVARVDRVDRLGRKLLGESACLLASVLVQGHVCVALPAALRVPVGLAVANEKQRGHL